MTILQTVISGASSILLLVCADFVLKRARRCEMSSRSALAGLIAAECLAALAVALYAPSWPAAICCAVATAVTVSLVMTRFGRKVAKLDDFGMTTHSASLDVPRVANLQTGSRKS